MCCFPLLLLVLILSMAVLSTHDDGRTAPAIIHRRYPARSAAGTLIVPSCWSQDLAKSFGYTVAISGRLADRSVGSMSIVKPLGSVRPVFRCPYTGTFILVECGSNMRRTWSTTMGPSCRCA